MPEASCRPKTARGASPCTLDLQSSLRLAAGTSHAPRSDIPARSGRDTPISARPRGSGWSGMRAFASSDGRSRARPAIFAKGGCRRQTFRRFFAPRLQFFLRGPRRPSSDRGLSAIFPVFRAARGEARQRLRRARRRPRGDPRGDHAHGGERERAAQDDGRATTTRGGQRPISMPMRASGC